MIVFVALENAEGDGLIVVGVDGNQRPGKSSHTQALPRLLHFHPLDLLALHRLVTTSLSVAESDLFDLVCLGIYRASTGQSDPLDCYGLLSKGRGLDSVLESGQPDGT